MIEAHVDDVQTPTEGLPDTEEAETSWQADAGIQNDVNFEKFATVADLAKGYSEASSMIGNSVRFPGKDAGDEDVSKFNETMLDRGFYQAPNQDDADSVRGIQRLLGLPSEAKGYAFDSVDGFEGDAESEGAFKAMAHENGLTVSQANAIHGWLGGNIANDVKTNGDAAAAAINELKGEWGQAFEHKVNGAKNAASMLEERVPGISDYFENMADNGQDANMMRLMDAVAEMLSESDAQPSQPREVLTKAEAQARVREIQNNEDHPANNPNDPHHEEASKQRVLLLKAAYS